MAKLSIIKIAEESGVSTATVSRVLNKPDSVAKATKDRVLQTINKYGYTPNSSLLKKSTYKPEIALIVPDISNPYYASLASTIQWESAKSDLNLKIIQVDKDSFLSENEVDDIMLGSPYGIIISGHASCCMNPNAFEKVINKFSLHSPVIIINSIHEDLNCVCISSDLEDGTENAVKHLYNLGHKRIALVGSAERGTESNTRENGYLRQMKQLGLEKYIYPFTVGKTAVHGQACMLQLLQNYKGVNRPTAIITYNDLVALGAFKEIKAHGLKIPEDIAVVSCDNQFFAPYMDPALTSSELHMNENCAYAVKLLVEAKGRPLKPFAIKKKSTLIIRESCGALNKQ